MSPTQHKNPPSRCQQHLVVVESETTTESRPFVCRSRNKDRTPCEIHMFSRGIIDLGGNGLELYKSGISSHTNSFARPRWTFPVHRPSSAPSLHHPLKFSQIPHPSSMFHPAHHFLRYAVMMPVPCRMSDNPACEYFRSFLPTLR